MKNINILGMLALDAACINDILKTFIGSANENLKEPEYGQSNGYMPFIATNFLQDVAVFVYEMLKNIPKIKSAVESELVGESFFYNLEKMRNAIHIRKPYGSFEERAKSIIENVKSDFPDSHFDLSLMYRITEPNTVFLSSNIYFYHMSVEIDKSHMRGFGIRDYSQNTAMLINSISQAFPTKLNYIKPKVNCSLLSPMQIEMFDYTIASLQKQTNLSDSSAIRIMLMHSYVSFINTFFELINADKLSEVDNCWLFFFAKLYSIRYDEVMDSFDNLNTYSNDDDKNIISGLLDFKGFDRKSSIREFAQKLRNLIHYGIPNYPPIYEKGESYVDIERVYLASVNLKSVYEFRELFYALRFDMKMMQLRFRGLFNMDYSLNDISLELARGGKILLQP